MKAIIFDLDGVILDSADIKTEAFRQLFNFCDKNILNEMIEYHITNSGMNRYKKIKYFYKEFLNEELTENELEKIAKRFSDIVLRQVMKAPFIEGVKDFIENNHKKYDMFIVSGTPQNELDLIISEKKLSEYFFSCQGASANISKEDIIKIILKVNGYNKKQVLYIGDGLSDYKISKKLGINFIGKIKEDNPFPKRTKVINNFNRVDI